MQKTVQIYSIAVSTFLTFALFASLREKHDSGLVHTTHTERLILPQVIKAIDLNRGFDFSGEQLPMDNFDVVERLDREVLVNAYQHANTLLNIKSARRYFPLFERILAAYGIPEDFKYLAVAESNFRFGTSSAGARGLWQFMPATAKGYNLEISETVDERLHVEKSTEAACKLILDYKRRFGSWTLAAAAYNIGETRLARELQEQQFDSFYDLNLNSETSRYIFRIVAFKEIMSNPDLYGFYVEDDNLYMPMEDYSVVETNQGISSLSSFAKQHGTTYRMLKLYNPWLSENKLVNKTGKNYQIKIPAEAKR